MERHAFYTIKFFMDQIPPVANKVLVKLEEGQKFREILNEVIEAHNYDGVSSVSMMNPLKWSKMKK